MTSAHVVGDATDVRIRVAGDPVRRGARVIGRYRPDDLAVLHATQTRGLEPAHFGDSAEVRVGDIVLAVGSPLGLSASVTEGVVSATGRTVTGQSGHGAPATALPGVIETSAPITTGNSGALVNLSGQVIGIPYLAAASPANGAPAAGIGSAIASNVVSDIAGQIIKFGRVVNSHRSGLGVHVTDADTVRSWGARVIAVTPGGPAERAGLRAGDVIRRVGDVATPTSAALTEALAALGPEQTVILTVARDLGHVEIRVTLGQLPGG